GIGHMEGISQLITNGEDSLLYVLAEDSKNIICFTVDGSGSPTFIESSNLGNFTPTRMALSPSENHLAIVSDNNTALALCAIPQD
ncbi:MAG: hypothetical protein ACQ5SW_06950, partial [Sphaerochaetaceae bacterium]